MIAVLVILIMRIIKVKISKCETTISLDSAQKGISDHIFFKMKSYQHAAHTGINLLLNSWSQICICLEMLS